MLVREIKMLIQIFSEGSITSCYSRIYPNCNCINFGNWLLLCFPISLIMLLLTWVWLYWLFIGSEWVWAQPTSSTSVTSCCRIIIFHLFIVPAVCFHLYHMEKHKHELFVIQVTLSVKEMLTGRYGGAKLLNY